MKFFLEADESERQKRIEGTRGKHQRRPTRPHGQHAKKGALVPALDAIRSQQHRQTPDETYATCAAMFRVPASGLIGIQAFCRRSGNGVFDCFWP